MMMNGLNVFQVSPCNQLFFIEKDLIHDKLDICLIILDELDNNLFQQFTVILLQTNQEVVNGRKIKTLPMTLQLSKRFSAKLYFPS